VSAPGGALVVGAGIAGLASARALRDRGYEVRVLERDERLRDEGAGLTLWPNAMRALDAVSLGDAVRAVGVEVPAAVTLSPDGGVLTEVPMARLVERFGPMFAVHRGELLRALADASGGEVEFGTEGRPESLSRDAELIVGADGIRSAVRRVVAGDVQPRPAGYAAWRGVAAVDAVSRASETMGRGRRFGMVPLPGGRTYWFAVAEDVSPGADLAEVFAGWHEPIADILAAPAEGPGSYLELEDLPKLERWNTDRAVLVGDAAHAMTPNLGQGAAQSLLDVAALARALGAEASVASALAAYETARKATAEKVAARSRSVGRVAQASGPLSSRLRDIAARAAPESVAMRQFADVLGRD
jgi:2-polyprenyl-6-methoxyphenol hydroxylase-like FAD-dependent oxidoreductase